jgi:hypothetical protein
MKVLAIDPGYGTGWATYDTRTGVFMSGEVWTFKDGANKIHELALDPALMEVVAENYIITARTAKLTQQTEALRLLGVLEDECIQKELGFTLQNPKKPKDNVLKALGWYMKTKDNHANSAAYHLYVYVSNRNLLVEVDRFKLIKMVNDD